MTCLLSSSCQRYLTSSYTTIAYPTIATPCDSCAASTRLICNWGERNTAIYTVNTDIVAVQPAISPVSETVSTALRSSAVPFFPATDGGQAAASPGSLASAPVCAPQSVMLASSTSLTQLPQIPRFSGEETTDGETFQDWHEKFESVAILGGWSEHGKLVNLTTRLKGAAYSFYCSCAAEHRNSYTQLVAELKKRFTPVQLTAIQTQTSARG